MAKRDTYNYNLKQGNKIVYKGTTKDLDKRKKEHEQSGKKFDRIEQIGKVKMEENAKKEQARILPTGKYRQSRPLNIAHKGP
ncbi:MAG: hypothetical protein MI921_12975 [Cytophagales bacterium]|nr:hypothetical protein [Cytophagales bacterium]